MANTKDSCSSMSGGYELVSLSSEYGKHLSFVVINNINHIHILLYDLIPTNLSYLSTTISKIDSLIKFCQNISHQVVNNIPLFKATLISNCNTSNSGSQSCSDQIKSNLEKLKTLLPDLYDSYGYINYLRIEAEKILKSPKDASGPNSNVYRLINAFSCSLSEFSEIERLLNSARSTIQEIKKTRDQLMPLTSAIPPEDLKSVYFQMNYWSSNIDIMFRAIQGAEINTWCLKYWICKYVNSSDKNSLSTLSVNYIGYFYYVFPLHLNSFNRLFSDVISPKLSQLTNGVSKFYFLKSDISNFISRLNDFYTYLNKSDSDSLQCNSLNSTNCCSDSLNCNIKELIDSLNNKLKSSNFAEKISEFKKTFKPTYSILKCIQFILQKLCFISTDLLKIKSMKSNILLIKEQIKSIKCNINKMNKIVGELRKRTDNLIKDLNCVISMITSIKCHNNCSSKGCIKNYLNPLIDKMIILKNQVELCRKIYFSFLNFQYKLKSRLTCAESGVNELECAIEGVARNFIGRTLISNTENTTKKK